MRFFVLLINLLLLMGCAGAYKPQISTKQKLSESQRLQLQLAKMHFDNGDWELSRKEYIRLLLNNADPAVQEVAQFMIAESYYRIADCPQAERYFAHYVATFPTGNMRAQSEVRVKQCEQQRRAMEEQWSTAKLRQQVAMQPPKPAPRTTSKLLRQQRVRATWYWIEQEIDYERKLLVALLNKVGSTIAQVAPDFLKRLEVEGTGRLIDGRLVNWVAPKRFDFVGPSSPYGLGAQGRALIPFRTVAVDRTRIALDTVLYIPEIDGFNLPSGRRHDGCFVAADVGSAIQGAHIDIFAPDYRSALQVMQRIPERLTVVPASPRCKAVYTIQDAL